MKEYGTKQMREKQNFWDAGNMKAMAKKKKIEQIEEYRFSGSMLTTDWKSEIKIKTWIATVKEAFNKTKNLSCSSMVWRKRLVQCYVWRIWDVKLGLCERERRTESKLLQCRCGENKENKLDWWSNWWRNRMEKLRSN